MATENKNFRIKNTLVTGAGSNNEIIYPTTDGSNGQVLTTDGSGNLSFADVAGGGTELAVLSTKTVSSSSPAGYADFGQSAAVSGSYAIVGEDDKVHIFDTETGSLLHTIDNPNAYGASTGDEFGFSVDISGNYAIVSAYQEDDAGRTNGGIAYIFNVIDGSLVHTLDNPDAFGDSDYFGKSVAISGNYAVVGAPGETNTGGTDSGKAYIFNVATGSLLYTLDNPNAFGTSLSDRFGESVAISGNYAIVGAITESDENIDGGFASGKAYIYDISTFTTSTITSANYVLDNPNPFGTSSGDYFGGSVSISGNYAIVGAMDYFGFGGEDDAGGTTSGKAYIYDISTFTTSTISSANYVLDNPNAYDTSASDRFGHKVSISGNYAVVGAPGEKDATATFSSFGITYIYDISTFTTSTISSANLVIDNPNSYDGDPNNSDFFGYSVAISGSNLIVGAIGESDVSNAGVPVGIAYIYKTNIQPYDYSGPEIASFAPASGGISDVVEDTTPQLGGVLDLNGNAIRDTAGRHIWLQTITGANEYIQIGNGIDLSSNTFFGASNTNTIMIGAGGTVHQDFGGSGIMGSGSWNGAVVIGNNSDYFGNAQYGTFIYGTTGTGDGGLQLNNIKWPNADGSNGQVLTTDGSGVLSFTTPSSGISNVVEDTTPQLGGNLDVNDKLIYNDTGTVKLRAGSADYVTIVNSAGADRIRFSDIGGVAGLGSFHQFGEANAAAGIVNIMGSTNGFITGSGSLRIHDNDSSAHVQLTVPATVSANVTFTLPGADGSNGQALTTDGSGNLSFADVSVETDRYAYEDTKTFVVTVDTKDSTHPQFNNGSANGYKIDGAFAPFIHMVPGMTYRFDQSDASNSTHPLAFYYDENKTTSYTDGVTNNGTPGSAGAYTQIIVSDTTPSTLYYQCSAHALMGWGINVSSHNNTGLTTDTLDEGSTNLYYTDSRVTTHINNNIDTDDVSEGSTNLYFNQTRARQSISADANSTITYSNTTGVISIDDSSYLTSETYSTASELLTAIKTVDGASSGLEADLLDGQEGSYYLNYSNLSNTPTSILSFGITDGTAGQVLQTDGSGNFSFTTVSGGGGGGVGYTGFEDYFFNVSSQTSSFGTSSGAHDKVQVFVNGAYLDDSDFTFNANTGIVTLTTAAENGDEVSVWGFNSTGLTNHELFTVDGSGNITAPGTIQIGNHRKEGSLTSTIASTSPTNVVMYASADYVGSKLIVTVTDTVTGDTQITEALILTVNGGTPKITTYGTMYTSANALASFDVANVSTNTALEVTMASSNSSTVKVAYTLIDA